MPLRAPELTTATGPPAATQSQAEVRRQAGSPAPGPVRVGVGTAQGDKAVDQRHRGGQKANKSGRKHRRPDERYGARRSEQVGFPRRRLVASGRGEGASVAPSRPALLVAPVAERFANQNKTTPVLAS